MKLDVHIPNTDVFFVHKISAPLAGIDELTIWQREDIPTNPRRNVHQYHCLYICLSGQGKLEINGTIFNIKENEAIGVLPTQPHLRLDSGVTPTVYLLIRFIHAKPELIENIFNRVLKLPVETHDILQKVVNAYEKTFSLHDARYECNKCGLAFSELLNYLCNNSSMDASVNLKTNSRLDEAVRLLTLPEYINLSVKHIAKRLGVTPGHLCDIFRDKIGKTPNKMRTSCRIAHAEHCLQYTDLSISQIAEMTGFKTIYSFSRFFAKHHNSISPTMFRAMHRIKP